jgi:hypothetical protein
MIAVDLALIFLSPPSILRETATVADEMEES